METMSRSVLSPAPVRCGRSQYALPFRSRSGRPWRAPLGTRGRGEPLLLQVRAKTPSSLDEEKQTSRNGWRCLDHETSGVKKSLYEEISAKVASTHLVIAGVAIAAACLVAFSDVAPASARAGDIDLPPVEPEVATVSSSKEVNLAKQLKAIGAKMYGAFWCSHCFEQKQMFGKEALKYIEYVECYPEGYRRGVKLAAACSAANIRGFPTWVIYGQQYSGEQAFEKLAELSGLSVAQTMK